MALALFLQVELIRALGSDDYAVRDEAMKRLETMGESIEPILRDHTSSPDPEIASRVSKLLGSIELARLKRQLVFTVKPDGDTYLVALRNQMDREILLNTGPGGGGFNVMLEYEGGLFSAGGGARSSTGCSLSESDFVRVGAGNVHVIRRVKPAAEKVLVSIVINYRYTAEAYRARCPRGCASHEGAERPWNRALEIELKRTWEPNRAEIEVEPMSGPDPTLLGLARTIRAAADPKMTDAYLFGVTGAAFLATVCADTCNCRDWRELAVRLQPTLRALGVRFEFIDGSGDGHWSRLRASIDDGVPVVVWNLFGDNEDALLTGYDAGKDLAIGWGVKGRGEAKLSALKTWMYGYVVSRGLEASDRRALEREALERAAAMAHRPALEGG